MTSQALEIPIRTSQRNEMINVTAGVSEAVAASGIQEGLAVIQVLHTTAGITLNENADPDVVQDMLAHLEHLVPRSGKFRHSEGNSDAHIKSSLVGSSVTVCIANQQLVLGTWQGIYFCEFDGPRERKIVLQLLGA